MHLHYSHSSRYALLIKQLFFHVTIERAQLWIGISKKVALRSFEWIALEKKPLYWRSVEVNDKAIIEAFEQTRECIIVHVEDFVNVDIEQIYAESWTDAFDRLGN